MRFFRRLFPLFLCTSLCFADTLIIQPDAGITPIIQQLKRAKQSVKLTMYGFTDKRLLSPLVQQKLNGYDIKIILEKEPYRAVHENDKVMKTLRAYNIPFQDVPYRLVHQKSVILDNNKVILFTFNFTHASFTHARNFGLIIDDPAKVKVITELFNADWQQQPYIVTHEDIIVSPTGSRPAFMKVIQQSQSSLKIYAQSITDYAIIGALAQAAKRGVHVQLLTSAPLRKKPFKNLTNAGVAIRFSKVPYIHAKVFIIDSQKALLGSTNLTRASLEDNRELSVISHDKSVVTQLTQTFESDWNQAHEFIKK